MKRAVVVLAVLSIGWACQTARADFQWHNTSTNIVAYADSNVGLAYSRTDSSIGCFVQLIYAGSDNQIDAAVNSGNGVTDDDVVHATSWIGRNAYGDQSGILPTVGTFTGDTSPGRYYVRLWTAPSPDFANGVVPTSATNFYGNSALWANPGSEPGPDEFNFGGAGDVNNVGFHANIAPVPEPGILVLGWLGLVCLRLFGARKR
jgi:hypothetical protein